MDFLNRNQSLPSGGEGLRIISFCPLCNSHTNPLAARVLDQNAEAHLLYINCPRCGSSIVALVVTGGMGLNSVGLITDLTAEDVLRFRGVGRVTHDEVLELFAASEGGYDAVAIFRAARSSGQSSFLDLERLQGN